MTRSRTTIHSTSSANPSSSKETVGMLLKPWPHPANGSFDSEERLQAVLLREIDALKDAMGASAMENSLVRLFERMIADKESAVQTVISELPDRRSWEISSYFSRYISSTLSRNLRTRKKNCSMYCEVFFGKKTGKSQKYQTPLLQVSLVKLAKRLWNMFILENEKNSHILRCA